MLQNFSIENFVKNKIIIAVVGLVLIIALCWLFSLAINERTDMINKRQQAAILTAEQARNINILQNQLDISKQDAEKISSLVKQAQTSEIKYIERFTVVAPSLPVAVEQVAERINDNDLTLPPVALEKSDRTIVVPNENKTPASNYDVGVFKINLDKPRGLGVYVSTESLGVVATYKNVSIFGGKKYQGGNELGVMYQARW